MYDTSDPRSALAPPPQVGPSSLGGADYAKFYELSPTIETAGERSWYARGQNFLVAYTEARAGAVLERRSQPDEYGILLPDPQTGITVTAGGDEQVIDGFHLTFVPPGDSTVRVERDGVIVRLFSTRSTDLAALCTNAAAYLTPKANVAPLQPWPEPTGGYRIRSYSLDVPPVPGRFGRIFRCTTLMVNWLDVSQGPRDPTKLSPHHHDDFQQGSLAIKGEFVHHLRWPWTPDMTQCRNDDHERCAAPSIAFIPPPAIHTSQAIGVAENQLVDIFSPPRQDFSEQPGWVLNADDYPMIGR